MEKNFLKALFLTILVQAGIYYSSGDRAGWNEIWIIIPIFCCCYIGVNYYSTHKRVRGKGKKKNVIDLDQYRRKKRIKKKREQRRKERKESQSRRVVIYKSCDKSKIELIQSLLDSHHIPYYIKNAHSASLLPSIEGIDVEIQVNRSDVEKSVSLLKEHDLKPMDVSP